jgi:catechol 2,3-dioxygenase-like lactoylglutathione lyase family enzyme
VKLNHLDLQVSDVQRSVAFFEDAFGMRLQSSRKSPAIAILGDDDGFTLVLQRRKNDGDAYPEGFHLGFFLDDAALVRAFRARAADRGYDVSEVIENGRGTLVYCRTEDGIVVEVSCPRRREPSP